MEQKVFFSSFRKDNAAASFAAAMNYLKCHPNTTLVIEPGCYTVTSFLAKETMRRVMAGDYGENPQRTMFSPNFAYTRGIDFDGQSGTTVIADGVTLLVDGFMEPVSLRNCRNVTLKGLTVDHIRKPYTQGVVTDVSVPDAENCVICTVKLEQPVCKNTPHHLRESFFDPETGSAVICDIKDITVTDEFHLNVKIQGDAVCHTGDIFCVIHTYHSRPAVLIEYAENITLDGVTIHSQPGMGIVGNRSENIFIYNTSVVPSPGQYWSTNTDATHFTSIKGKLVLQNCKATHQGDDFTNVHTYYHAVVGREADNICFLQEKTPDGTHAQTLDYPDVGDVMELTEHDTLRTVGSYRVTECVPMQKEWMCRVTFDRPLPENTDGLMLADVTRLPELTVKDCTTCDFFSRGILIKTRSALITGNKFKNGRGPGIEAAAESWWYEGVCPAHITIKDNVIEDCGLTWGDASGVLVKADCDTPQGQSVFDITVSQNRIKSDKSVPAIFCRNVDGLEISGNKISVPGGKPIETEACINIIGND